MNAREMDDLLGTNGRLAIVATLAGVPSLTFTDLGRETGLADGNLHVQTRKLLAGGYLTRLQDQKGRRSITRFALSEKGRDSFQRHLGALAATLGIRLAGQGTGNERVTGKGSRSGRRGKDDSQVW